MIFGRIQRFIRRTLTQKRPMRYIVAQFLVRSRLSHHLVIKRRLYNIRFFPTAMSISLWTNYEQWTKDEDFFVSYLRKGDTCVDIGANIGTLTLTAAAVVGESGKVYSVEAHPQIFGYLERNIELNGFKNIKAHNVAVGQECGIVCFSDTSSDDSNSVVSQSSLNIKMTTLDDLLHECVDNIALLKIDVEGYEKFVCLGGENILKKTDCIYIESYNTNFAKYGYSSVELLEVLSNAGFTVFKIDAEELIKIPTTHSSTLCENLLAVRDCNILRQRLGELKCRSNA